MFLLAFAAHSQAVKNPPVFANALTPDGDGQNDVFAIGHLEEYPDNELTVYTRWGNEVYKASPYRGDWKGECNTCRKNDPQPQDGVYFYVFTDRQTGTKYNGYVNLFQKRP